MPMKATVEEQAVAANAKMAELQEAYKNSPDQVLARDKARLEQLRNDPYHLNRKLGGSTDAAWEERAAEMRVAAGERAVAQAEAAFAQTEEQRIDAIMRGSLGVGPETTMGDQIPHRDLASAAIGMVEAGVHPERVEYFLKHGRYSNTEPRSAEIVAAKEWERRLMSDPTMQQKLLSGDPELKRQFEIFGMTAAAAWEK